MAISEKSMATLMAALAPVVAGHVDKVVAPLKARIAELEARPQLKYHGTFKAATRYPEAAAVTHSGSLFIAKCPTTETPGESQDWQLCVKRGRDGKDGRDR
jgi:hypothetical protein